MTEAQRRNLREKSIGDLLKDLLSDRRAFPPGDHLGACGDVARDQQGSGVDDDAGCWCRPRAGSAGDLASSSGVRRRSGRPADVALGLVIGGAAIIIALVLVMSGKRALSLSSMAPTRTADSIKKDARLVEEQVR